MKQGQTTQPKSTGDLLLHNVLHPTMLWASCGWKDNLKEHATNEPRRSCPDSISPAEWAVKTFLGSSPINWCQWGNYYKAL